MSSYRARLSCLGRPGRVPPLPGRSQPQHAPLPYPPDLAAAEWAALEPVLPSPAWPVGRGGRPSRYCMRDPVDAIRCLAHNGPARRALPGGLAPAAC